MRLTRNVPAGSRGFGRGRWRALRRLFGRGGVSSSVLMTGGARSWRRLEEEVGRIKGHFGPINALAVNPDGRSYCSGSEDGYVRLHHFGADYLERRDPVPEEIEGEG